ncbi:hypothetical protein D3C78_1947900 [compost metagenome]
MRSFYQVLRAQGAPAADAPLSEEQLLAPARRILLQQREGEARRAALEQLRAGARIEVLVPL